MDISLCPAWRSMWFGFLGHLDVAVIEVAGANARRSPDSVPSTRWAATTTSAGQADKIALEVSSAQPAETRTAMHDIYYGAAVRQSRFPAPMEASVRPHHAAHSALRSEQGDCAVVPLAQRDRLAAFTAPDRRLHAHCRETSSSTFAACEGAAACRQSCRLPQSGVGDIANASAGGLGTRARSTHLNACSTEVLQDGMLDMLESGKLNAASTTCSRR